MTGEEMERAIEFLLDTQARTEARLSAGFEETNRQIAETNRQLAETNQRLDSFADTQAALMQVVTETFAAHNRINEDVRRNLDRLSRAQEAALVTISRLGERQERTEASVDRLVEAVRRHLEGGNGNARG